MNEHQPLGAGMRRVRYLILGAGPAGLAFAISLLRQGETSFLVLEKEAQAGGLCKSTQADGFPLDMAGCHLLEYKNQEAAEFVFSFLPKSEWQKHERHNSIDLNGTLMGFPFEANIWQLPAQQRERYLADMRQAPARLGEPMPDNLYDWAYWNFGKSMAEDYFIPYNRKIWPDDLRQIGTYWLYKLPPISYEDVENSCSEARSPEKYAAHKTFYYPKQYGFGEAFRRMERELGEHVLLNTPVRSLDYQSRTVNGRYQAEVIINTVPWPEIDAGFPQAMREKIAQLQYTSLDVAYHAERLDTHTQAIYYPNPDVAHHRAILRYNYNAGWPGYWTESNAARTPLGQKDVFHSQYAYPANTLQKPESISALLRWAREHQIYGLGRWGEWEHWNCDTVISRAIALAERFRTGLEMQTIG